jgi:hypothetical protein
MPTFRHTINRVAAALLVATVLATALPAPSFALDPPRPLPGYRPTFVTERQPGPWVDCTWASAAMLLDKWTNGSMIVSRQRLRVLAKDPTGGSSLADVRRSFARLGVDLKWSPAGGERISWTTLLRRLGHGSGAILLGDYGKLPRRYARWDPTLWTRTGPRDDHAIYLDAYDRKTGRILVMDPLAPPGWGGEWVPASALEQFAWHTGSAVWAATTPTAAADPFAGVQLDAPTAVGDAVGLHVHWPIDVVPRGWTPPTFRAAVQVEALAEPDDLATDVAALPADPSLPRPPSTVTDADTAGLDAIVPLPAAPGIYRVSVTLTDNRFGKQVATAGPFNLFVPGPRAAGFGVPGEEQVEPGALTPISFAVANIGTETWAETAPTSDQGFGPLAPRNSRLVGSWLPPEQVDYSHPSPVPPPDIDFGPVPLEPGRAMVIDAVVRAPTVPGSWRLVLRVVDDREGAAAFLGSAPAVIDFSVGDPGGDPGNGLVPGMTDGASPTP